MKNRKNEGIALITVLILMILMAGIAGILTTRSIWESKHTDTYVEMTRATEAADAGLALAGASLWSDYLLTDPLGDGSAGTIANYRAFLDNIVADGQTIGLLIGDRGLPNGANVQSIQLTRQDDGAGVSFTLASTGASGLKTRTAIQQVRVGGQPFAGFDYAMLANNLDCIMCHATFDNIDRVMNTDPNNYGTYERIKIGALESITVHKTKSRSRIAGTIHTRGKIIDKQSRNEVGDLANTTIVGYEMDSEGNLVQDASGDLIPIDMALADTDPDTGLYEPNQSLYTDYPTDSAEMTDGELPSEFPPAIPDENGDKVLDSTEFSNFQASSTAGSAWGGVAHGVAPGDTYGGASLPDSSNGAAANLSSNGSYSGNVFLVGTDADPIHIDGNVFIDGDVVIRGKIQGTGQIYAKGNIFIVGDTTYNDASGEFGVASSGAENLVAYAAGGNIVVGDYLTQEALGTNRNNKIDVTAANYLTPTTIDQGGPMNSGLVTSFTTFQTALYNMTEHQKAQADPSYNPRYYTMREGGPVILSDEKSHKYDSHFTTITPQADAAIVTLGPKNGWISELFLKQVWRDDENSRPAGGSPFKVDGLLYTNNLIMALTRSMSNHNSRTLGQLTVRGAIIAADVGILAPSNDDANATSPGFTLLYDQRVRDLLAVNDVSNLTYTKRIRVFGDSGIEVAME